MAETSQNEEIMRSALIDMAIEGWRFSRTFARLVGKLDAGESNRYVNQLRYYQKRLTENLEDSGLRLVNLEGQPYDPGLPASAINIADFGPDDLLVVDQMLEPIIMDNEGVRKSGTVMVRKVK